MKLQLYVDSGYHFRGNRAVLRYIKMKDGSEFYQLYEVDAGREEETQEGVVTDDEGETKEGENGRHNAIPRGDPIGLMPKSEGAIYFSIDSRVMIKPYHNIHAAYILYFESQEDAPKFAQFFPSPVRDQFNNVV